MTYYETLEISEKASQEVIHMAYKALCKKYHPDIYQGDKYYAEEQMKRINEAYTVLSDELRKKEYDDSLKNQKQSYRNTYSESKQEYETTNIDALIKRGFMALEDGEWIKADIFFEQALNQDAEIAEAYLGKLMIELQVTTKDDLKYCALPFDSESNYQRALRFADDTLKAFLLNTIQFINQRNYETECDNTYFDACNYLNRDAEGVWHIEKAVSLFKKIPYYKDSSIKIQECEEKIKIIKENIAKQNLIDIEKRKKATKLTAIIGLPAIFILSITIIAISAITKSNTYNEGISLIDEGKYVEAITVLGKLNDYKNSRELVCEAQYLYANKLIKEENYLQSKEVLNKIIAYKNTKELIVLCNDKINETNYEKSLTLLNEQKFIEAYDLLRELASNNYKDSKALIEKHNKSYEQAVFNNTLKTAEMGSVVTFGTYEQDDNFENGKEPVNWIIIDRNEHATMLISEKVIEIQSFDENTVWGENDYNAPWEKSTLRKSLNGTIFDTLFNSQEQQNIIVTTVVPDPKKYSTSPDPGGQTLDKVYLLSKSEYYKYQSIKGVVGCQATKYVFVKNKYSNPYMWWLRSSDSTHVSFTETAFLDRDGVDHTNKCYDYGIRPVFWIKFE